MTNTTTTTNFIVYDDTYVLDQLEQYEIISRVDKYGKFEVNTENRYGVQDIGLLPVDEDRPELGYLITLQVKKGYEWKVAWLFIKYDIGLMIASFPKLGFYAGKSEVSYSPVLGYQVDGKCFRSIYKLMIYMYVKGGVQYLKPLDYYIQS